MSLPLLHYQQAALLLTKSHFHLTGFPRRHSKHAIWRMCPCLFMTRLSAKVYILSLTENTI
jgi:hypothetical protein